MKLFKMVFLFLVILSILPSGKGSCLESKEIIRLRNAGVDNTIIELIIKDKIIETCALTIDEIIELKEAGLNDKIILSFIKQRSFLKNAEPRYYGKTLHPVKSATIHDLIKLKEIGMSDDVIGKIISLNTKNLDSVEREEILDLLKDLEIFIDLRESYHEDVK